VKRAERLGGGVAGEDLADPVVLGQQELQLVEGRPLVVDDQHAQRRHRPSERAETPGANLGTRTVTLVPASGAVSTTRP
jgi:hypothetical protein